MMSNLAIIVNEVVDERRSPSCSLKTLFSMFLMATLLVGGSCDQQPIAAGAPLELFTAYLYSHIPLLLKEYGSGAQWEATVVRCIWLY